jgi:hypothetical protein
MASEWYYTVNGQQAATPVSTSQLKQMAGAGQLQPTDLVWQEGMANWVPASSIKGLFGAGRSSAEQPAVVEAPVVASSGGGKKNDKRKAEADETEEDTAGAVVGLHPLIVFLLSVCTLGLFGLVYAYMVCSSYADQQTRERDAAGRPLGRARHPMGVLLLSYLTFGLYFYFWAYRAIRECVTYTGRTDCNPRTELALMLVFPPYAIYVVVFRLPELIRSAQAMAKVTESPAVNHSYLFLNPCLFPGLPFLSMVQQDALNQVWFNAP